MPLIPNYVSRLRTHSQSTAGTGSSTNTTNTESRSASTLEPPLTEVSTANSTNLHTIEELERKIHPDLSALVAETAAELPALEPNGPVPPRRKAKSVPQLASKEREQQIEGEARDNQADTPSPPRTPLLTRILAPRATRSQAVLSPNSDKEEANSPNWATFGRKGVPIMSRLSEFGSLHRRESSSKSSSTKTSKQRTAPPSSPSSSAPQAPSQPSSSPAGTVSSSSGSKAYSQQSYSLRSRRHPLNHPDPIPDTELNTQQTPPSRSTLADLTFSPRTPARSKPFLNSAPNTFGRNSKRPTVVDVDQKTDDDGVNASFTPTRTSTPPPPERLVRREPPHTYPLRSRKRSLSGGGSVSFPMLPGGSSRPSVESVFRKDEPLSEFDLGSLKIGARKLDTSSLLEGASGEMVPVLQGERDTQEKGGGDMQSGSAATKNPSFFGSVGRDRQAFLRAAQRTTPSSLTAGKRSRPKHLSPALAKSAGGSGSRTLISTTLFPRGSALRPLSTTAATARMNTMSDPGPALPESGSQYLDMKEVATSPVKRKMLDSQDDVTMQASSSGGTRGILLNTNRESSRPSDASHAPSSYRLPKRIRLSTPPAPDSSQPPHSRSLSPYHSHPSYPSPPRSPSSRPPSSLRSFSSQASSLPVRAIVSPKPPSIVSRHSSYHMRDPALPPRRRDSTQWTGGARKVEFGEDGREGRRIFPLQAWAFIMGFLFFPVWWIAAVMPLRWGWRWRRGKGKQNGKEIPGKDVVVVRETLEYDVAYTWRQRCRITSLLGLFVYVPLIVLLAIFVPRA